MNEPRSTWQDVFSGALSPAEAARQLGVSEAQVHLLVGFHQASRAQLALEQAQQRRASRRAFARGAGVALVAGLVVSGAAVAANGTCPNGYPFCFAPNDPARAIEVNHNFSQIKEWLETKVGVTSTANVTMNGSVSVPTSTLSFGPPLRQMINLYSPSFGLGVQASTLYQRSNSNFAWYQGGSHTTADLNPGGGGSLSMSLVGSNLTVSGKVTAAEVSLPVVGDTAVTSAGDSTPEVYRLTGTVPGHTCDANHRGTIFVAQPTAQTNQDSLCYCGSVDGAYEVWCFNP